MRVASNLFGDFALPLITAQQNPAVEPSGETISQDVSTLENPAILEQLKESA